MKLTCEQSQRLLHDRGIRITDACDKCGQLLGSVRWTRRGEPGDYCSAGCRDGIKIAGPKLPIAPAVIARQIRIGSRPSGRPRKHENNAEKCRHYRRSLKIGLATRNAPTQAIENSRVADAKNCSPAVGGVPEAESLESLPIAKSTFTEWRRSQQ
jgi:hypothetical protein